MARRLTIALVLLWLAAGQVAAQTSGLTFSDERKDDVTEEIPPPLPSEEAPAPPPRRGPAGGDDEAAFAPPKDARAGAAPVESAPEALPETEHPRGHYLGVKPGGAERPTVPTGPGQTPAVVTWPGFAMRPDGGSRVFLQLSAPVDVAHQTLPDKVIVDLQGARVAGTNNRYPLETRFFNTPVLRATLKRSKTATTLELTLRKAAQPRISSRAAPSGYHFLYVDFPAGDYLVEDVPAPPPGADAPAAPASPPAAARAAQTSHLPSDTEAGASGSVSGGAQGQLTADTSHDDELPPGMGKVKVKGQAKVGGGLRLER